MTARSRTVQNVFFYALLLAVFGLVLAILWPYLGAMVLAAALAVVLHSVHVRLVKIFGGRRGLAAFLTVLFVLVIIGLPLSFVGYQVLQESKSVYTEVATNRDSYTGLANSLFTSLVKPYFPDAQLDFSLYVKESASWILTHFGELFSGTAQFLFNILLGIMALFYFLRDGEQFKKALAEYSPLPDKQDREIFERLDKAVHSVLRGSVLIALIQGTMSGLGFWFFSVPNPALWGSVAAICALVPGVGTSLVLVPAIIYLFVTGDNVAGVGLLLWSALAVGLIDNVLAPSLVGHGASVHPVLILFSVLGGVMLFGPLGFIFGPLTMSLFLALLGIYRTYFNTQRRA